MSFLDDIGLLSRHATEDARNALKGLLGGMPLTQALRGELDVKMPTRAGLEAGLMGIKPFQNDPADNERVMMEAMNTLTPMGLLGMAKMTRAQAKAGGETGLNNQFYKGGEFLPSSAATEKGMRQFPKSMLKGNVTDVEPFVKAERPFDGAHPIMKSGEWAWDDWRSTGVLKPNTKWVEYQKNPAFLAEDAAKAEAFNRGARWTLDGRFFDVAGNPLD